MRKFLVCALLVLTVSSCTAAALLARQAPGEKTQSADDELRARVATFYRDILKNDRVAALELVAPEARNQFLSSRFDGMMDFRIASVDVAQSQDQAIVKVIRSMMVPNFSFHPLDLQVTDTWRLSNGQWYYVLPPPGEVDTPFGKLKFDSDSSPSAPEVLEMRQKVEKAYKNVDFDQYLQALQKVAGPAGTESTTGGKAPQAGAAAPKPDSKQTATKPAPVTPAPGDTSKPQQ